MSIGRKIAAAIAAVATLGSLGIAASTAVAETKWDALSNQEKNSSYGFFIWKSENAKTQAEKDAAAKAAGMLKGNYPSETTQWRDYYGNNTNKSSLITYTHVGNSKDATSLANMGKALQAIDDINAFRRSLPNEPCRTDLQGYDLCKGDTSKKLVDLQPTDMALAAAQLNVNWMSQVSMSKAHANVFDMSENGAPADSGTAAAKMWYEEKSEFDSNDAGYNAGHYDNLTDKYWPTSDATLSDITITTYMYTGVAISSYKVSGSISAYYGKTLVQDYLSDDDSEAFGPAQTLSSYCTEFNEYSKLVRTISKVTVSPSSVTVAADKNTDSVDLSGVKATVTYDDGTTDTAAITWNKLSADQLDVLHSRKGGTFTVKGTVSGSFASGVSNTVSVTVKVTAAAITGVTLSQNEVTVPSGTNPKDALAKITATAAWNNGETTNPTITWDAVSKNDYSKREGGDVTVRGAIDGFTDGVTATVHVTPATITKVTNPAGITYVAGSSQTPQYPSTVKVTYSNGDTDTAQVQWDTSSVKLDTVGKYTVKGTVAGTDKTATITVTVADATIDSFENPADATIDSGKTLDLSGTTVKGKYSNGTTANIAVKWKALTDEQKNTLNDLNGGSFTVKGTVQGTFTKADADKTATIKVHVNPATVENVTFAGTDSAEATVSTKAEAKADDSVAALLGKLPRQAAVKWTNHTATVDKNLTWTLTDAQKSALQARQGGTFDLTTTVQGRTLTVHVTVEPATIVKLHDPAAVTYVVGAADQPTLPTSVKADYSNGDKNVDVAVNWDNAGSVDYTKAGEYTVTGHVDGSTDTVTQKITVTNATIDSVSSLKDLTVESGAKLTLPGVVDAKMSNGQKTTVAVQWDDVDGAQQKVNALEGGDFTVTGTVQGTFTDANASKTITVKVHVKAATVTGVVISGTATAETNVTVKAVANETESEKALRDQLPATAAVSWSNHTDATTADITWPQLTAEQKKILQKREGGSFDLTGTVKGVQNKVTAHITVQPATIASIANAEAITVVIGTAKPTLPTTLKATYTNGDTADVKVVWANADAVDYTKAGDYTLEGSAEGYTGEAPTLTIHVVEPTLEKHDTEYTVTTKPGVAPTLPDTASTTWSNGQTLTAPISWNEIPADAYAKDGSMFDVAGTYTVNGQTFDVVAHVTVKADATPTPNPSQPSKPSDPSKPSTPSGSNNASGSNTSGSAQNNANGNTQNGNAQNNQQLQNAAQSVASTGSNVLGIVSAVVVLVILAVGFLLVSRKRH